MRNLPIELWRHIYEYDGTYRDYFTQHVLPEVMDRAWSRIFNNIINNADYLDLVVPTMNPYTFDNDDDDDVDDDDSINYIIPNFIVISTIVS